MHIVNVGYDSTNYYVLADAQPKLLVDVGWPGTLKKLEHQCQRSGVQLSVLRHFLLTHYHPDHAGLAQELKRAGLKLIVMESQLSAIPTLRSYMKPQHNYLEIDLSDNIVLDTGSSRAFLARLGIAGEIIETPGHSDDSVSLILDQGAAFTGDLTPPMLLTDDSAAWASWDKIRASGAAAIYPGHGPVWNLDHDERKQA